MTLVPAATEGGDQLVASYRQLAEIYHDLLSREDPDLVLEHIVQRVRRLIPVASILVAEADTKERVLRPLIAEGGWPDGFMETRLPLGEGLIGLAAERGRPVFANDAHLDERAGHVEGTPFDEPEAIISLPLVARGVVIGAMSLYREGEGAAFSELDFELAQRFADAATLAIENARTREGLRRLARCDELTGIQNRRAFNEQLAAALGDIPPDHLAALVLADLNDFKSVNDAHGHLAGDEVLRAVAMHLEQAAGDFPVFRIGGDEFAALVVGPKAEVERAVTRIATRLASFSVPVAGEELEQTASIGIAKADGRYVPARLLLHEADHAMYRAKRSDGNVRPLRLVGRIY
jgi:diguanylate cyclase (GGDEF)-like protein